MTLDRRLFLLGSLAAVPAYAVAPRRAADLFADLRGRLGPDGRVGVAALDSGTGKMLTSDANSRFAMASTFKLGLAGAILAEVEAGRLAMSDRVAVSKADLVFHAPVVEGAIAAGHLTVAELAAAIVEVSDNAAANLLLGKIGGPSGLTRFFRRCGDRVSRLDRWETELNSNLPGDPRDTTTPAAMVRLMRTLLVDGPLRRQSRQQLAEWLVRSRRGLDRLRAGLPDGWRVGTKAGTGARGAMNDLAIAWPPRRPPILIASYLDAPNATDDDRAAVHREIARRVATAFA